VDRIEIAERAGVTLGDLECLRGGRASANIAEHLGLDIGDVEYFIHGSTSANMTTCLGFTIISAAESWPSAAAGLRQALSSDCFRGGDKASKPMHS
jgi:hypothetical protein